ncbi:MAG: C25 family cysteine peptidase [Acidobacteria bacterium]|nr:C25 family cysteine peptidase [Acidobacteriota bacterium]
MLVAWRTLITAGVMLAMAPALPRPASAIPDGVVIRESGPGRVVLDVRPPQPTWQEDPVRGRRVVIPGYGLQADGDWPWLPEVRLRFATGRPEAVRLRVEIISRRVLDGLQPARPLEPLRLTDPADPAGPGTVLWRLADPRPFPLAMAAARLGPPGALRRTPFVELYLTPVLPVSARGALEFIEHYRVTLEWPAHGRERAAPPGPATPFARQAESWLLHPDRDGQDGAPMSQDPAAGDQTLNSESTAAPVAVGQSAALPVLRPALPLTPTAGSVVYGLDVQTDGVYRLSGTWLAALAPDLTGRPVAEIFVAANGVELPIQILDDGDGVVSAGDDVIFFAEGVHEDFLDPDEWEAGDYTDIRPYYLGVAAGARVRMSTARSGAPVSGFALLTSYQALVHSEEDDLFLNSVPDDLASRWYDEPFLLQTATLRSLTLALPAADPGGVAALKVRMLGALIGGNTSGLHRTRLSVNNLQVDEADWDGVVVFTQGEDNGTVTFPASQLTDSTTVDVELPLTRLDGGVPLTTDLVALDWVEVSYDRLFTAAGNTLLFTVPNQDATITVDGLTSGDVVVYETTEVNGGLAAPLHLAGAQVSGAGSFQVTFELAAAEGVAGSRSFAVMAGAGLQPDPGAVSTRPATLDLSSGGADWLLLGADDFLDLSPSSGLSRLLSLRQSQGLQTSVVPLSAVYDQFSFGVIDPQAIRDFIAWSLAQWSPAPTFVVLVGDASFDYKNNFQHAIPRSILPTYMGSKVSAPELTYFSMDNKFAAVLGSDDVPDVLLGRLAAHDAAEAESLFTKLADYGAIASGPAWTRRGFFLSDAESGGFEFTLRLVIDKYIDRPENPGFLDPNGPCFSTGNCRNDQAGEGAQFATASMQALITRNPSTPLTSLAETMLQWIKDGLNAGAAVTYYNGHGGFQAWGRDVDIFRTRSFDPDDVDDLANGARPTFLININCITGGFHADSRTTASNDLSYSLAEDMLVTPDRGAIGVLAPSHLTFISILGVAANALWDRLLGDERDRLLGELNLALRLAFSDAGAITDLRSFAFLGDPATRLVLPDPAPPGVPVATAGDGVVDLTWTAGPDASTFQLERSGNGATGPYTEITPEGFTSLSFSDTTVSNGSRYFYRLRGRDGNGMSTVPANTNADCPDGPGCVVATPLNPDPPGMPAGFAAVDTGEGGELELTWLANPEPDIDFYRVRYGIDAAALDQEAIFNSRSTTGLLVGLTNDQLVTLTVEAVYTSGLTSPPTAQVAATPRFVLGLRPPRSIVDLMVTRDGNDAVLAWTSVTEDQYGDPITISSYAIHASSVSPVFIPSLANQVGTVGDLPSPSFRHLDGISGMGVRFYLVQATDTTGGQSAAGSGLPQPVTDLAVSRSGADMVHLGWSSVTVDVDGARLAVDHYEVYAAAVPFSRADLSSMTPVRPMVLETGVDLLDSEGDFFSVVAVTAHGDLSPF